MERNMKKMQKKMDLENEVLWERGLPKEREGINKNKLNSIDYTQQEL